MREGRMEKDAFNDSSVTANMNGSDVSIFPKGLAERHAVLGICGIVINLISIPIVVAAPKLYNGLKILMLNLSTNDIILMSSICAYGLKRSSHVSDGEGCWEIVYLIILCIIMSYFLFLETALVNFLAIYTPIRFRSASRTKYTCIAVMFAWIFSLAIALASARFDFPKGLVCLPVAMVPRSGIPPLAVTTMFCFGGVLCLNVGSIVLIRRRKIIMPEPAVNILGDMSTRRTDKLTKPPEPESDLAEKRDNSSAFIISDFDSKTAHCNRASGSKASKSSDPLVTLINNATPVKASSLEMPIEGKSRFSSPAQLFTRTSHQTGSSRVSTLSSNAEGSSQRGNSSTVSSKQRTNLFQKVEINLIVLTSWSCMLSLPFIFYMWVNAFTEDRVHLASNTMGVICSSLVIINSLSNPFFYVWRFINWHQLYQKLRRLF